MAFPLTVLTDSKRECGDCVACCVTFPVPEVDKPRWQPCKHLCGAGCEIHADRPDRCRQFNCLWLAGNIDGDERRRPDRLGLLFYLATTPLGTHLCCQEVWENAADAGPARYFLNRLGRKFFIYLFRNGDVGRELLGPPALVQEMATRLANIERGETG